MEAITDALIPPMVAETAAELAIVPAATKPPVVRGGLVCPKPVAYTSMMSPAWAGLLDETCRPPNRLRCEASER